MKILLIALVILFFTFLVYNFASQLSRKHGSDIRLVWYFFSLSLVVSCGIVWWGINMSAINVEGNFQGSAGETIHKILEFMLDLNTDIQILCAIVALITLPQILNYLLSGIFGCASTPLLVEESVSFLIWSLVKLFAVTAGILVSMAVSGLWNDWHGYRWEGGVVFVFMSVMMILFSFIILVWYRDTEGVFVYLQKKCPEWIRKMLVAMHMWCTRCEDKS